MSDTAAPEYRVLARKYRPSNFDELIGQGAMVRTLSNAIETGRLAHAFILTGVRGVGKTTTARIIARALNCVGPDGQGGPTISPCGQCEPCRAIAESRHVDVLEMDAASRTGVDDIREIIDGVQYASVSARFKIYIIDEVHMLSRNAFNALLKTLEEPPGHVKFIFATTEIRKVPVTVLSRCQRFDLRRVEGAALVAHLKGIVEKEGAGADDAALTMIARAAEGSVRDSLSLLDQAIAHTAGDVSADMVRSMLGLADRAQTLTLMKQLMGGEVAQALGTLRGLYDLGAEPSVVLNDLLELTHWLTRLKLVPSAADDILVSEAERTEGRDMAETLSMPHLTRAWQMLLKGVGEVAMAANPLAATEMVLIRLGHAADMPNPADLIRKLQAEASSRAPSGGVPETGGPPASAPTAMGPSRSGERDEDARGQTPHRAPQSTAQHGGNVVALRPQDDEAAGDHPEHPMPTTFEALVALFQQQREGQLALALKDHVRLVSYTPGRIAINPTEKAPTNLATRVKQCLSQWTGTDWAIIIEREGGTATLRDRELEQKAKMREEALADPLVQSIMQSFPDAKLVDVLSRRQDFDALPPILGEVDADDPAQDPDD